MGSMDQFLSDLCQRIQDRDQRVPIPFTEYMELAAARPALAFRNIFQMFHDMITNFVGTGIDEYPDDPESIHYVHYDCHRLFVEDTDHPFFADRLFANRLINHVASFRHGAQQNRIVIFEGPPGSGKSTFLNNLLMKFEQYSRTDEGASYETVWRLDKRELGALPDREAHAILQQLRSLAEGGALQAQAGAPRDHLFALSHAEVLEVPCPSHDSPLLMIPKAYRREFLEDAIPDESFKRELFSSKQYEWVFRDQPCTICMSLYQTLLDLFSLPGKVFSMVFARRSHFNRRLGEGISVFNPGDGLTRTRVITNPLLQNQLNAILRDSNRVKYLYSRYAKTNNGIYALMDIKAHNRERLENLHGIISEGVHKVEDIEENVNSLFLAIMNPEDHPEPTGAHSFADRITTIKVAYVLDYSTEVKIYEHVFGSQIRAAFLPRVLENFAKVILSSRLSPRSEALQEWIDAPGRYHLYCDENLQLLKMDIYSGIIPPWLSQEDRKRFTAERRRRIIGESEHEGDKGFSGRDSLKIFNELFATYAKRDKLINMGMVCGFFKKHRPALMASIPDGFLDSLLGFYNYTVLQEVKESLYLYNESVISREIQNYLFAVNFESGRTARCIYTGDELQIDESFFKSVERRILGSRAHSSLRVEFRHDVQSQYASRTLTQEILLDGRPITETEIYRSLHQRYLHHLKEDVLEPFLRNDNFRSAVKDFGAEPFKAYEKRIREDVTLLVGSLQKNHGYSEQGAKEVCLYVIDNNLAGVFAGM